MAEIDTDDVRVPGQTTSAEAIIPAGEAMSNVVNISDANRLYIITPPAWSPIAVVTMQFSIDALNFYDLFMPNGYEFIFVVQNKLNAITPLVDISVPNIGALRLRSGTRGDPMPQLENRRFIVVAVS